MKKNGYRYLIITFIILVIYNVAIFAIPFPNNSEATFWLSWVFGLVAIIAQPVIAYYALKDSESLKSKLYGWPIIKLGYIYLVIQMILTVIFLVVGCFVKIPVWIFIVPTVLVLGFTSIGLITTKTYKEEIEKMEEAAPLNITFIKELRADTKTLANIYQDKPFGKDLEKLAEEVRFSDPVSSDAVINVETKIAQKYEELKETINKAEIDVVKQSINELMYLVQERNQRVKSNKRDII